MIERNFLWGTYVVNGTVNSQAWQVQQPDPRHVGGLFWWGMSWLYVELIWINELGISLTFFFQNRKSIVKQTCGLSIVDDSWLLANNFWYIVYSPRFELAISKQRTLPHEPVVTVKTTWVCTMRCTPVYVGSSPVLEAHTMGWGGGVGC